MDRSQQGKPERPQSPWRHATAGIELGATFLLFLGLGLWLDSRLDSSPWLTLAGTLVGFGVGLFRLQKTVLE